MKNGNEPAANPALNQMRERVRAEFAATEQRLARAAQPADAQESPLRKLLRVSEQLNATHDVSSVLQVGAREVIDIFEAERVFILDAGAEGRMSFRFTASFQGQPVPRPELEVSHVIVRDVARTRAPVLVRDATRDTRFANVSSVQNLQLHSVMAAPLLALGELKGIVYADNRRLPGIFDESSLDRLALFASHIGTALHNAELFEKLNATRAELAQAERLKAIGQMAAYIVHEIKNPLTSIQLLTDALRARNGEKQILERFLQIVPGQLDRLNRTVREILDYARPTPVIKSPIRLNTVVEATLAEMESQVKAALVQVVTQFEQDAPAILGDGEQIGRALANLIRNGIEALGDSPVRQLRITLRREGQDRVELCVQDTGPGIPEKELSSLFEPFHTTKKLGTGLGLALCQKIVREHGGGIAAENASGSGASFRISLPAHGN